MDRRKFLSKTTAAATTLVSSTVFGSPQPSRGGQGSAPEDAERIKKEQEAEAEHLRRQAAEQDEFRRRLEVQAANVHKAEEETKTQQDQLAKDQRKMTSEKLNSEEMTSSGRPGFLSPRYYYDPYKVEKGIWETLLGVFGAALSQTLVTIGVAADTGNPETATRAGEAAKPMGEQIGESIGKLIDNSHTALDNAHRFLNEVSDWSAWSDAMQSYGGPIK